MVAILDSIPLLRNSECHVWMIEFNEIIIAKVVCWADNRTLSGMTKYLLYWSMRRLCLFYLTSSDKKAIARFAKYLCWRYAVEQRTSSVVRDKVFTIYFYKLALHTMDEWLKQSFTKYWKIADGTREDCTKGGQLSLINDAFVYGAWRSQKRSIPLCSCRWQLICYVY
jgi:hypothetical protein